MPIPDFQSLMLPLLQHFADGEEHANQETMDALAKGLQLTEAERGQLLPSGKQTIFTNRVAWAKSHFKQAGLLDALEVARAQPGGREIFIYLEGCLAEQTDGFKESVLFLKRSVPGPAEAP